MPRPGLEGEFLDGTDDKADGDDTGTGCAHHEEKDDLAVLVLAERVVARADGIGVRDEPPRQTKLRCLRQSRLGSTIAGELR